MGEACLQLSGSLSGSCLALFSVAVYNSYPIDFNNIGNNLFED